MSASTSTASAPSKTKESAASSISTTSKQSTHAKDSARSIMQRNVEDNVVVWLDASVDDANDDDQQSLRELKKMVATVQRFANSTTCAQFFEVIEKEKVFLICSGSLGEEFLPKVHDQVVIQSIYIFCGNKAKHEKWACKYPKVKGVYTEFESLCKKLKADVQQTESSGTGMRILNSLSGDLGMVDPYSIDSKYMHSEILKWYLVNMPHDDKKELEEFVDYCIIQYADSETDLGIIDEFRRTYDSKDEEHTPIWWYTRECFIYKMLNKALRVLDTEVILKMGFFFSSLHRQICRRHTAAAVTSNFEVYRGQGMETSDFLNLKKSINGFLTFTSFLSTSTNKDISIPFAKSAKSNPNTVGVLFIITIDSTVQRTYFASISDISFYKLEDEILFSSNTVFRVRAVEAQADGVQHVHLQLIGEDDEKMVTLIDAMMREVRGVDILDRLGSVLYKMNALKEADEIFQRALQEVSAEKNRARLIFILENLAIIHADGRDSDGALFYYNLALEQSLSFQSNGDLFENWYGDTGSDLQIARLYGDIGTVLHDQGDLKGAEEHYERNLQILMKDPKKYEVAMSTVYFNIGTLHDDQERFGDALKMFQQSLDIRQRHLHSYHPQIASTYLHMVKPCLKQRQFVKAEEYSRKGIELYVKSHPAIDNNFSKYYYERALSLEGLESFGEALKYAEKALEMTKRDSKPNKHYEEAVQRLRRHV